jgi:low temperature requirement protein LtrA
MVAVMTGMGRQEYWSPGAAASAILGMALVFTIWWWYFDGVEAVGERTIRSTRDAVRFHVWSYAHLPLYLAIAVAGVGVEHVIITATTAPLHAAEGWILCAAVATLMAAIIVIDGTRHRVRGRSRAAVSVPAVLTVLALLTGAVSTRVMPSVLLAALTVLSAGQLAHALRRR